MKFELNEVVKDKVTGFTGLVISRCESSYENNTYRVQPEKLKEDGSMQDHQWIDESRLQKVGG